MKKRIFSLTIFVILVGLIIITCVPTGALSQTKTTTPSPKPTPVTATAVPTSQLTRIVFGSLLPGSARYTQMVALSQLVNSYTDLKVTVRPVPRPLLQWDFTLTGEVHVIGNPSDTNRSYIYRRVGLLYPDEESKDRPAFTNMRMLMSTNDQVYAWITRADSGIKTIADLKGKKVSVIPGLYPATWYGRTSLRAYGLDYKKDVTEISFPSTTAAVQGILDGKVIAAHTTVAGAKIVELDAIAGCSVLPFDADKLSFIEEFSPTARVTTPGSYRTGLKRPTPAITVLNSLNADIDLSEEVAYLIVKTIVEHIKEVEAADPDFVEWTKDRLLADFVYPFHPGAIKYYKEIGIWTPRHDALQKELLAKLPPVPAKKK